MNSQQHCWKRLAALAGRVPDDPAAAVPPGFATRVVARWLESCRDRSVAVPWEGWALRGLGLALVLMVLAVAFGWPIVTDRAPSEELVALAEPWDGGGSVP